MTEAEERLYLEELLLESARWTRDPDEPYCSVELEIRDRLRRLNHVNTVDENGLAQSVVERGLARQQAKNKQSNLHVGQVRVCIDGKPKWFPESMCMQIPFAKSKNGKKWVLKQDAVV
jgi:hypothetical protein